MSSNTQRPAAAIRRRQAMSYGLSGAGLAMLGLPGIAAPAAAQQAGVLRVSANVNPSTLDPATGRSGGDHQFLYPLYDTLVAWEPTTLEPRPGLAQSWTYKDASTVVLELRPGLTFHDGTPLDAEAVKFNLDRNRSDPKSNIKVDLAGVESVEATGPTTVTIKLKQADQSLPLILSDRAGMMASPTAIKAGGGSIDRVPVGAGPWKFARWDDNALVAYERNPTYWRKGIPKVDRLEMKVIPEVSTGVRSVIAGENDVVVAVPAIQKPLLDRSGKVKVFTTPSLYLYMIYLDFSKPPLNDVRVRRAINLAIDREVYSKVTMGGLGQPATTLFPKEYWAHDPALANIITYDPDKAKALLKEAGSPSVTFTGVAYTDQAAVQRQEVLMEMWRRVGINPKIHNASVPEASQAFFFNRTVNSMLAAITARPDPSMAPYTIFGKDSPYNGGHQEIPGMEAALAASRVGATPAARKEALSKVQRIALEQAVFVPLAFDVSIIALSNKYAGFQPNLLGRPRYEEIAAAG
ncbi:peptide ABC transporter [Vineibacter terrae]|uniref:Peptide ABC transporter n=1 Tax=Vineibacter terrae TaxID=2586908 RepID=A0A5C8PLT9_9HYPH|nr:ABC transporter substrate-binding protein [Vineibacter terrae]TXL74425.1 peptide ABC transporter [Vineibacter terrae]